MQRKPKRTMEQLLPLFMQTGVGIVILLILWLVIVNLPMLEEISLPLEFTFAELLAAVVLTLIITMLVSFGMRMELRLGYLVTDFPQGGTMVKHFVFLIAILIAYFAFRPLGVPYLDEMDWIYHLLFLVVFLAVLAVLGKSIYSNIEAFTEFLTGSKRRGPSASAALLCSKCGEKSAAGTRFCSFCGEKLPQPLKCSGCGTFLRPGAKFCPGCGAAAGEPLPNGEARAGTSACASCNEILPQLRHAGLDSNCRNCGYTESKAEAEGPSQVSKVAEKVTSVASPLVSDMVEGVKGLLLSPAETLRSAYEGLPRARRAGFCMIGVEAFLTALLTLMLIPSLRKVLVAAFGGFAGMLFGPVNNLALFMKALVAVPVGIAGAWLVLYPLARIVTKNPVDSVAGLAVTGLTRLPAVASVLLSMVIIWVSIPVAAGIYLSGLVGSFAMLILAVKDMGHLDTNRLMYLSPAAWLAGMIFLGVYLRIVH